ncbi:tetratricopeptide repeat protein [Streptomyces bobili]|uniref:tetratricopeptide repeat protein n=1 Tax=Streptomyces bobili TaxID=67280 RepID=UPI00371B6D66
MAVRSHLATAYHKAGHTVEAMTLLEQVTADCERLLGEDSPEQPGHRLPGGGAHRGGNRS